MDKQHHLIGPLTARRILTSLEFTENFRGDNVRHNGKSVYVAAPPQQRAAAPQIPDKRHLVRIVGRSSIEGRYTCQRVKWDKDNSEFVDVTGDKAFSDADIGEIVATSSQATAGAGLVYVGDIVTIRPSLIDRGNGSGKTLWEFTPAAKTMPVDVATDGGDAGDDETPCTLTYTVTAEDGETLLTGASPQNQRRGTGEYAAADQGCIHYELESGVPTLTLGWVNEEYVGEPPPADDNEGYNQSTGSASTEVDATKTPGGSDTQNDNGNLNYEGVSDTAQGQPQTSHIPVLTRVNKHGTTTDVWQWVDPDDLPVTSDSGGGGAVIFDKEIDITENASTGVHVIDSTNYSGRACMFYIHDAQNISQAAWEDTSESGGAAGSLKIGYAETADVQIFADSRGSFFIDVSDGYQLKYNLNTAPGAGLHVWYRLIMVQGSRKDPAAADIVIDD